MLLAAATCYAAAVPPDEATAARFRDMVYRTGYARGFDLENIQSVTDYWGRTVICGELVGDYGVRHGAFMTIEAREWPLLPTLASFTDDLRRDVLKAYLLSGCASVQPGTAGGRSVALENPEQQRWLDQRDAQFRSQQ